MREGGTEVRKERGSREGNLLSGRPGLGPVGKFLARKLLICLPCFSYLLALITPTPSFGEPPSPVSFGFWWGTSHKVLHLLSWGMPVTHPDFCSQNPNFDERALRERAWRGGPQTQPRQRTWWSPLAGLLRWISDTPTPKVLSFRTNSQRYKNHQEKKHLGEVHGSDPS